MCAIFFSFCLPLSCRRRLLIKSPSHRHPPRLALFRSATCTRSSPSLSLTSAYQSKPGSLSETTRQGERCNTCQLRAILLSPLYCTQSRSFLSEEGLFRVPGHTAEVFALKQRFDSGEDVDLSVVLDCHTVAGLLKQYRTSWPQRAGWKGSGGGRPVQSISARNLNRRSSRFLVVIERQCWRYAARSTQLT